MNELIGKIARLGVDFFDFVRSGRYSYGEFSKLKQIQYYDKKKMTHIKDKKIRNIINHAYTYVPFYKKLYDREGINHNDVKNSRKIEKLPIITKSLLRKNFPNNVTTNWLMRRARYDRTSGSTGEPFEFYNDIFGSPTRLGSFMLFNTWMGVSPNDKHVQIASPKPLTKYNILKNKVFNKYKISTLNIRRNSIKSIIDRINQINPVYLEGYSASLDNTAQFITEMNLELRKKPRAIVASSEDLIEPHRKRIENVFDTKVYNRYGSREFSGAVAQECGLFEGLHINTSLCYVEIVDEEGIPVGEGERGRIIITDYDNYVMPFIRYDIGDSAIKGPDKGDCNMAFPIIKDVKGKSEYFLISSTDERTPIETVASYLFQKYAPNVRNFQFIHDKKGNLLLKIVPTKKFNKEIINAMHTYLKSTLKNFSFSILIVDEISPLKSGKTPYFIVSFPH